MDPRGSYLPHEQHSWNQQQQSPSQQRQAYNFPSSDDAPDVSQHVPSDRSSLASNVRYPSYGYQTYHATSSSSSLNQPQSSYASSSPIVPSHPHFSAYNNAGYTEQQQVPPQHAPLYGTHGSIQQIYAPNVSQVASSSSLYSQSMTDSYSDQHVQQYSERSRQPLYTPMGLAAPASEGSPEAYELTTPNASASTYHPQTAQFRSRDVSSARHTEGGNKRQRSDDLDEDDGAADGQGDSAAQSALDKIKRACARCKGLKVRCEFKDDQDTCERCSKGSHECVIPGRKKRRPPPKREVLLTKIREQAAQIEELMSQLEAVQVADRKTTQLARELPREFALSSTLSSPGSTTLADSLVSADTTSNHDTLSSSSLPEPSFSKEDSEWIAQARQKLEAFGGFIGLGGASTSKEYFVEQDFEDSASSGDDYAAAVRDGSDSEEGDMMRHEPERERGGMMPRRKHPKSRTGKKLSSIPSEASPFGLMANLSMKKGQLQRSASVVSDASDLGVANDDFFRPSPNIDPGRLAIPGHEVPMLLQKNIITSVEAEKLFKIYFDWMNISVSLLDPVLYTAQQVYWRCPFLFTVICAIASRYDRERPDLYPTAVQYARQDAGTAFLGGDKRVEVVQAYILLSLYPVPARRWEDDRCWIYLGQGIRMAMDMNLHHPNTAKPRNEQHAREMLNRTRAWLNCFNLDRSMGSQYGKTTIIRNTDYVASRAPQWWNSSEHNLMHFDIHLAAYNGELRLLNDFMMQVYSDPNHPTGLNKEIDMEKLATETDDKIEQLRMEWFALFEKTDTSNVQNRFRIGLLSLAYSYARLVALSFGFQHAFGKSNTASNPFLIRCINAATDVVNAMVDDIGRPSQRIYVRHGPDAQSVFVTFSCTFLIKLLQPKYASYISPLQREEIINTVQRAVDFSGSPDVCIDDRHGPKLYSRFISGLLESVKSLPVGGKRAMRKSKRSVQPPSAIPENAQVSTFLPQPSPPAAAKGYFDPLPPRPTTPFDHFAIPTDMHQYQVAADGTSALGLEASEFFRAPLPLDSEILQSMQSISSLSEMQDTMLPGFGWMGQMPLVDVQYGHQVPQSYH